MGLSASTSEQKIQNDLITNATNSCPPVSTINVTNLSGMVIETPPDCPGGGNVTISQAAVVNANCLLQSLQESAAKLAATLNAQAKAGLGIAVSTDIQDIKTSIEENTKNTCAGASTTNIADISNTVIKSCNFTVTQDATENVSCQINATQDMISKIAASASAHATGGSILGDLFGGLGNIVEVIAIIAAVIIVLIIVGILLFLLLGRKGKKNNEQKSTLPIGSSELTEMTEHGMLPEEAEMAALLGGFRSFFNDMNNPTVFSQKLKKNKSFAVLIILILIVFIIFLIGLSKNPNKKLTENDINNLNQKIAEAHQAARFT